MSLTINLYSSLVLTLGGAVRAWWSFFTTVSCRSPTPVLSRGSSFVTWSFDDMQFHDIPIMSCRHLLLNTFSILFVLSVAPCFAGIDGSWDDNWCVEVHLCILLIFFQLHTGRRCLCTEEAFPIRMNMSQFKKECTKFQITVQQLQTCKESCSKL